jgi:hypothetical protein
VRRRRRAVAVAFAALFLLAAPAARAQGSRIVPEARLDAIIATRTAVQPTLGADVALSPELRLELAGGLGVSAGGGPSAGVSARADAIVRFLVDPRHAMRWSPYVGGGIGVRYDRGPDWRGVAIFVAGASGPRWGHWAPFVEAGFGGGVRLGFGVRRAPSAPR